MKSFLRKWLVYLFVLLAGVVKAQETGEYLVEINLSDGTFAPVGGPMEDGLVFVYVDRQCKDEVNGHYIFVTSGDPDLFHSWDISSGEIVYSSLFNDNNFAGFHCLNDCDTLITINCNQTTEMHYVSLYDRINGLDLGVIGDSLPDDNDQFWGIARYYTAFDQNHNLLYRYNWYSNLMFVTQIPEGDIIETYQSSTTLDRIYYDEVNDHLYGVTLNGHLIQLFKFNEIVGDFEAIGDEFEVEGTGYMSISTDGNNERMIITLRSSYLGSFVVTADLNTGQLLSDEQTMLGSDAGPFGGPNTLNGVYFNSTDQMISLHWGTGSSNVVSTTNPSLKLTDEIAYIYPNPNSGQFNYELNAPQEDFKVLRIYDSNGSQVYEKADLQKEKSIKINLSPGTYTACFFNNAREVKKIPFIIN